MNLLYFTQIYYPFLFGGGEYIFYLIAKELVKRGHTVQVVTQRFHETKASDSVDGIKIYRVAPGIKYAGILPPTIKHNLKYLILASKKGIEIVTKSRKKGQAIDIIHSNTYVPALSGQICSALFSIPHIVTFHDVFQASSNKFWTDWSAKQNANLPAYTSIASKMIERIVMHLPVDAFHTVSETSREDLLTFNVSDKKIKVIPNGLEQAEYQDESYNDSSQAISREPSIVFVGRLVFYKNLETVIKAFKKVVELLPKARLIIVGDGPYKNNLIKASEPIKNNVVFTGRVSNSYKIRLMAASSFVVFPSTIEGFGIAIIEGFACKKAVLVSDVRPLSDIVKDGYSGYVIPPFDVSAWTNKIIDLLNDKDKQEKMGSNAYQEFLSKYEIRNIVSKMEALYKSFKNKD
jgi:glycosyltransferase involved in cell wall biosynthesis